MKRWKTILGLLLIFLLGTVAGAILARRGAERQFHRIVAGGPEELTNFLVERLRIGLHLDPQQYAAVRQIGAEAVRDLNAIRQRTAPDTDAISTRTEQRIRETLRPDQQATFDRLVSKRKPQWVPPKTPPKPASP